MLALWAALKARRARRARLDAMTEASAAILRRGFREDGYGDRIPPALLDDRAQMDAGVVVELRPRVTPAAPRHRKSQRRRP